MAGLAVLWGVAGLVNLLIPRADFYGSEWYQQYSSLLILGIVILLGLTQHAVMRARRRS